VDNQPNYYELLHVQPDAPTPVIKASYRAMMQKMRFHPDLGGDEVLAQQLNKAVATLSKTDSRQEYDDWLAANSRKKSASSQKPADERPPSEAKTEKSADPSNPADETAGYEASPGVDMGDRSQLPRRKQCPFCHAAYSSKGIGVAGYREYNRCAQCKGAIPPIESISMGAADDIRKIYRHTHHSQVWLHTRWPIKAAIPAAMTDLSIAGCAIHCHTALTVQSVIMLDTQILNSICQVRYQKQLGPTELYSIGLEFITLDIVTGPGSVFTAIA
jgi:hypothetical protein